MEKDGEEGEKYEHKLLQSCLVELPTSSTYYTSACSQLSTHSLKTVKSCETNIDSITYSDLQHKLEILNSQSCLTKHEQEAYFVAWEFYCSVKCGLLKTIIALLCPENCIYSATQ